MELDLHSLFGLLCTAVRYSLAENPATLPLPPAFRLIYEGAIGQLIYVDESFYNPLGAVLRIRIRFS
jgi:hypothetical protein